VRGMSAVAPPPLPDVPPPLPRPALPYAPPPRADTSAQGPVGLFMRLCLCAPVPLTFAASALLLLKAHASGADFRHDSTHGLVRTFDFLVFGSVVGVAVFVAGVMYLCTRRRLGPGRWRFVVGGLVALTVSALSLPASEAVFRRAKSRAYASVNFAALAADCAAMASAPRPFVGAGGDSMHAANDPIVPGYTRSTGARWVRITPAGVYVIMSTDLFAGVHEEGFFVPASAPGVPPPTYPGLSGMTLLNATPLVYRYAR
jgi:hypothetical protein